MAEKQALMLTIDKLLRQIAEEQEKRGTAGSSSTADISDSGSRAAEYAKDVKKQVGEAAVDGGAKAKPQEDVQPEGGTQQTVTDGPGAGEKIKTKVEDPGTASSAKVAELAKQALEQGNLLLDLLSSEIADAQIKAAGLHNAQVDSLTQDAEDAASSLVEAVECATKLAAEMAGDVADYLDGFQEGVNESGTGASADQASNEAELLNALAASGGEGSEAQAEGGEDDERVEMLASILDELGVSPEDLEAALSEKEQASNGKTAAAQSNNKSKWVPKTAGQLAQYRAVRDYIKELVGR